MCRLYDPERLFKLHSGQRELDEHTSKSRSAAWPHPSDALEAIAARIAADPPADVRARVPMAIEHGSPLGLLHEQVKHTATELLIPGIHRRTHELPCDAMIVPPEA